VLREWGKPRDLSSRLHALCEFLPRVGEHLKEYYIRFQDAAEDLGSNEAPEALKVSYFQVGLQKLNAKAAVDVILREPASYISAFNLAERYLRAEGVSNSARDEPKPNLPKPNLGSSRAEFGTPSAQKYRSAILNAEI